MRIRRHVRLLVLALASAAVLPAHDLITTTLTYSREVSRLLNRRCVACHREGGAAPMALTSYEQVRPWAKAIKEMVLSRQMPPWGAVKGFGHFAPDDGLSQEEILLLAQWVEGGAPQGDPAYLPPPAKDESSPAPPRYRSTLVAPGQVLRRPLVLLGISPVAAAPIATGRLVAIRPDGSLEPLLWLHQYNPQWQRTFLYREPIRLPAGTRIHMTTGTPWHARLLHQ